MLRTMLSSSALAALLVCTACDQPMDQTAQQDQQSQAPAEQGMAPDQQMSPTEQAMNEPEPIPDTTPGQTASAIPLTDVTNPEQTLAQASVQDSKGAAIGEVASVNLGPDGRVQMVNVEIGERTIALEASNLRYVQAENTIVADQTKEEIESDQQ